MSPLSHVAVLYCLPCTFSSHTLRSDLKSNLTKSIHALTQYLSDITLHCCNRGHQRSAHPGVGAELGERNVEYKRGTFLDREAKVNEPAMFKGYRAASPGVGDVGGQRLLRLEAYCKARRKG